MVSISADERRLNPCLTPHDVVKAQPVVDIASFVARIRSKLSQVVARNPPRESGILWLQDPQRFRV